MKLNLFCKLKEVSSKKKYYIDLKNKKIMGGMITLGDIENIPINRKVKRLIR